MFSSEKYTQYLKTMAKFHTYSLNNTILISMQRPDATLVTGYERWKSMGRQVKKGEKAIRIIAPVPVKENRQQKKLDEENKPILDENGDPEIEEVEAIVQKYKVTNVFDISQTEGDPIETLDAVELTAGVENYAEFLQAVGKVAPVPIRFDELTGQTKGYFHTVKQEIVIQKGMAESQTLKTAIHETAHSLLHNKEKMAEQEDLKNRQTKEVEAESVAFVVCSAFGLDTSEYSLGRGLRKCKGKKYLNVLDFIGNYHKAGRIRYLLTGRKSGAGQFDYAQQDDYPDGCLIDFDMRLIDLFAEMDKKLVKLREQIYHEYCRIKDMLGERPSRVDFFTYMDEDVYQKAVAHAKDNPFKNYLGFLKEHNELNEGEMALCNGIGYEFIKLIENTNMTKVYKMPVLQAIYNDSDIRMEVTNEEIVDCWKAFFDANENWRDFDSDMTYEKYRNITDKAHLKKIMQMPVNFLIKSGDGFFCEKEGYVIALNDGLKDVVKTEAFAEQMRDVVEYRVLDYYQRRYDRKKSG